MAIMNATAAKKMIMLNIPFNAYQNTPIAQMATKIRAKINKKLRIAVFER